MDRYNQKLKAQKAMAPYLVPENDPDYIKRRPADIKPLPEKLKYRSKPKKVLTNLKHFARIGSISKAKRKGDKMATEKTNTKTHSTGNAIKSAAWLVLAVQQGFVGYVLLANFSNYFVIAAAGVSLGIAGIVVVAHFVRAHR